MVSIIIATHKGAERQTHNLVESIKASSYRNYEIIVVNEGKERSTQRNIGIKKAKGEYIFWPDSDWVISPWLLFECVMMMKKCDALYIPENIKTPGLFAYIRNWERQFYNGTCIDVVRFVKRDHCPLFDESLFGPEDTDWDRRVTGKRDITWISYDHYDNVGFKNYFRKKSYYAQSMDRFEKKNKDDKILDPLWRCFGVFFEDGKWKRVLKRPDLFLAVMVIIAIRGVILLSARKS